VVWPVLTFLLRPTRCAKHPFDSNQDRIFQHEVHFLVIRDEKSRASETDVVILTERRSKTWEFDQGPGIALAILHAFGVSFPIRQNDRVGGDFNEFEVWRSESNLRRRRPDLCGSYALMNRDIESADC
jgi:hypothetical protein